MCLFGAVLLVCVFGLFGYLWLVFGYVCGFRCVCLVLFVGFVDLRLVFVLVCGGVGGCVRSFGWVCLVVTFGFIYLVVLC